MFKLITRWGLVGVDLAFRRILSLFDFGNLLIISKPLFKVVKIYLKLSIYILNTARHDKQRGGTSKQLVTIQEATNNVKTKY